ncbi:LOG family protein [Ramlibacter sp.]|uniref:LOG family protein n=1 Tax=Ramlibacter sp. TaxID=1917967 RepID=UPI0017DA441A|nr:LOG family protein [Ramlibacter sp.]MBA2676019.1 LOG family protein [Ramlibacter sp.]
MHRLVLAGAAACALAACTGIPASPGAGAGAQQIGLHFSCTTSPAVANASYVGRYAGMENAIPALDAARDIHCADAFKAGKHPRGFVTLFGSSRIAKDNRACDAAGRCDETPRENDSIFAAVREFALLWTAKHGRRLPILTGAGPGLMEAANEGAQAAGGPSIGYTTYYDRPAAPAQASAERPYGGDPSKAFNPYVSDGLIFTSVVQREAAMIRHAAAVVIAPGGTGTEWEIYQVIETIKSGQQAPVPVYFLGDRATVWRSLDARLKDLVARRVVRAEELAFLRFAATPAELLERLASDLGLP